MSLKEAINKKNVTQIRKITSEKPVADIADMLEELTSAQRILYFRLLKTETQAEVFSQLEHEYQEDLIKAFSDAQLKEIVGELYSDEIADLVEEVPDELARRILKATDSETRSDINKILKYSETQTGSIMNVDIITLKQSWTVKKAVEAIREQKDEAKMAHYFFVTDAKQRLTGLVALEDLVFEKATVKLSSIMKPAPSVSTTTELEEAAIVFANYDLSVLPVVNSSKVVIGMLTSDEMIDVVSEVATEDMQKMAGIDLDNDVSYLKTSVIKIVRSRIFWLMLAMFAATLSQVVLDAFQNLSDSALNAGIIATTALVAILPVISGSAGNAGAQSSTTIIRLLATGEITTTDYFTVFFKEFRVSVLMGLLLGIANFVRLILYYLAGGNWDDHHIILSAAASIALLIVVILAKIVGGTLPILAKKLKLDPAVLAAPLLTTLIDALSTTIFFGVSIGIMVMVF